MKELDNFTVKGLEKWIAAGDTAKDHHDGVRVAGECLAALARIALAAKMAEPEWYVVITSVGVWQTRYKTRSEAESHIKPWHKDYWIKELYTTPHLNSPEIPEGWKLVPIEPTLAMLTLLGLTGSFESMLERYANMLDAAPEKENG